MHKCAIKPLGKHNLSVNNWIACYDVIHQIVTYLGFIQLAPVVRCNFDGNFDLIIRKLCVYVVGDWFNSSRLYR